MASSQLRQSADRPASRPGTLASVALAFAVIMVDGFDLQAIGYVAPEIARSWSLPLAAFGPVFSAALAGSILGALLAGSTARRIGLRATLLLSLVLFGVFTLAILGATQISTLVAVRVAAGVGLGAAVPVAMNMVAENSPARFRASLVTLALCGQPIGAIAGAALCAHFMPIYGWRFAFDLGGIVPLLLAVAVARLSSGSVASEGVAERASNAAGGRFRDLFGGEWRTTTFLLSAGVFFASFFLYLIVNWLPGSVRSAGYSLQTSILAVSLFNFGGIAGGLACGVLIDRYGAFRVLPLVFALGGASMTLLDISRAVPALLLAVTFMSGVAGYGAAVTLGPVTLMQFPPPMRTLGTGWVLGIGRLGAAIGPLGAGALLAAGLAIGRLFYVAATAAILVMICMVALARVRGPIHMEGK